MQVRFKKLSETAVIPTKGTKYSAGFDLTADDIKIEYAKDGVPVIVYSTNIAMEIPDGHVGMLFMRSSIANMSISMTNAVGVIDSKMYIILR